MICRLTLAHFEIKCWSAPVLPFGLSDSLYGLEPGSSEEFSANFGALATRGERGVLIVSLDWLFRMSSNPFLRFVKGRIKESIWRGRM